MSLYSRDKARRSLIDTALFRALSQVATALAYVVQVRGMTREDFGVFNLLYAFIPVVSTLASFGLEQILRRYQPEYLRAGNTAAATWLYRFVVSRRFGTNVLILALVLLTWNYVAPVFKMAPYRYAFAMFCPLVLLYFQARILQLALGSYMMHRFAVGSTVTLAVVKLVIYSILAWQHRLTLEAAILADTIAYAIAFATMHVIYRRYCYSATPQGAAPPAEERKRIYKYGIYNNFNDAGVLLLYSTLDSFFIAAFIDPISVGIYAFYTRLNQMVNNALPGRLFDNVIQPMFFATLPAEADAKMPVYFSFLLNINLLIQMPILAFVTVYHTELVRVIFGGKFIEESWLLPLVMGFAALNIISDPCSLIAQYEEKIGILLLSKISVIYNIVAMAFLVPWAGIYGAAIASGTAQLAKNCFVWWFVRRRAIWINFPQVMTSTLLVWGSAIAVGYMLKESLRVPPVVQLLLGTMIFASAALLYLRSSVLSNSDRNLLASLLRGKEAKLLRRLGVLSPPHAHTAA